MKSRRLVLVLLALGATPNLIGCGDSPGPADAALADAHRGDGFTPRDSGLEDAGLDAATDGGSLDAGMLDVGAADVGQPDAGMSDAGPPLTCGAAEPLSSASLGGVDRVITIPRDGATDVCAEAGSPRTIDGVLYYDIEVGPGEGVDIVSRGVFVGERTDCDSGCGDAFEEGVRGQRHLNRGDDVVHVTAVFAGDSDSFTREARVRFNPIEPYVDCATPRVASAPSTLTALSSMGVESATEIDCPRAFALDGLSTEGMFVEVDVPAGATLRAEAESRSGEFGGGSFTPPTVVIARSCPDLDGVLTCIGEPPSFGVARYANTSDSTETVLLFGMPSSVPRFDLFLTLE